MDYEQYDELYSASKRIDVKVLKTILASEYDSVRNLMEIFEAIFASSMNSPADSSIVPLQNMISSVLSLSKACDNMDSCVGTISYENSKLDDEIFRLGATINNSIIHVSTETYANAGDFLLVKSLRQLLEYKYGKINWIRLNVQKAVTQDIVDSINKSKALIIGGGGLFLKDTNQNEISGWQWPISKELLEHIRVPVYVLGVGYNRFRNQEDFSPCFYENVTALVQKSSFFGLRNHGSVNAVREFLPDSLKSKVAYFPCATTVISKIFSMGPYKAEKPMIAINCAFDRENLRFGQRKDYILRCIAKTAKNLSSDYDILCYLHCEQDVEMCRYMDEQDVSYGIVKLFESQSELDMIEAYSLPSLVIGMRGHSQMVAFGCGTPTLSIISHNKIKWFLDDIEHPEWGLDVCEESFEEQIITKAKSMLSHSADIRKEINKAQESIWNLLHTTVSERIQLS